MGVRGVLAGVLSVVLVGGGSAFPALAAEDPLAPWEGPYESGDAPVGEVREPRDAADVGSGAAGAGAG